MGLDSHRIGDLLMATDSLGWEAGVFRALLVGSSYSFNHVQTTVADIMTHELNGGGYARQNVVGRSVSLDLAGNRALFRASSTLFPAITGLSVAGVIIYKQIGGNDLTPGDDPLFCYLSVGPVVPSGQDVLVEYDPDGVVALTTC